MKPPVCTVFGRPNGAGKTTFAMHYLPHEGNCTNFANADLIAAGLSPLSPEREWLAAGRLFLTEIRQHIQRREDFLFESTLAGRGHLRLVRELLATGWTVDLYYLWLPSVETSIQRVAERVSHGGHGIPEEIIARRYPRSIRNLLKLYAPLCSSTVCMDNSGPEPVIIFTQRAAGRVVEDAALYDRMLKEAYP